MQERRPVVKIKQDGTYQPNMMLFRAWRGEGGGGGGRVCVTCTVTMSQAQSGLDMYSKQDCQFHYDSNDPRACDFFLNF